MQKRLCVGSVCAAQGKSARGSAVIGELGDGSRVEIPIAVVNGANDGPVVWIQAAVHGDEYVGLAAIQDLLASLKPDRISGAVICVPIVNVLALRAGSRGAPQDGMDLNRVYPGGDLESVMHIFAHSELVADFIVREVAAVADVVIDLHDGGWMGEMSAYVQYFASPDHDYTRRTRSLAYATGMDIIWESPPGYVEKKAPGSIGTVTKDLGLPTLTIEIGGEGRLYATDVGRMTLALKNVLTYLGCVPFASPTSASKKEVKYVRTGNWLRARHGGIYVGYVRAGDVVKEGEIIGEIRDAFGTVKEQLVAPVGGVVIGMRTFGTIATGQYAGNVAQLVPSFESEERGVAEEIAVGKTSISQRTDE